MRLVSGSQEKQARWLILSDFSPVSVDRFSQRLNKLRYVGNSYCVHGENYEMGSE